MRDGIVIYSPNRGMLDLHNLSGFVYVSPWPDLYWNLWYDEGVAELQLINWCLDSVIPNGKVFVDIGSNIGVWTMHFAASEKVTKVVAFDPNLKLGMCLKKSLILNDLDGRVSQYTTALGSPEHKLQKTIEFNITYPASSQSTYRKDVIESKKKEALANKRIDTVTVPITTLDSFLIGNIGFLKLDVEGSELDVLKGSVNTLEQSNWPKFIFECWPEPWWTNQKEELFSFIKKLGYRIVEPTGGWDMFLAERP